MNLEDFAYRLMQIVEENHKNGRSDRNRLPVGIEFIGRTPKTTKFYKHNRQYQSSCKFTARGTDFGIMIEIDARDEVKNDETL